MLYSKVNLKYNIVQIIVLVLLHMKPHHMLLNSITRALIHRFCFRCMQSRAYIKKTDIIKSIMQKSECNLVTG